MATPTPDQRRAFAGYRNALTAAGYGTAYETASFATRKLTDAERIRLMYHLLDAVDFDDPDLRSEMEGQLAELDAMLEGALVDDAAEYDRQVRGDYVAMQGYR
ncbi:hypothetical protein [Sphingopyxis indica]|uniref:Uncharacterized protein n=1 Tax=Sphingopyxis indica TaxID=436663 RepID=A0A239KNW5_9SPHN|nr:hypothetical protein [Sphingopyxis indica]SNT20077.1 hypothetical protein SAMN06295955_11592 [Sphingopyxis indica]